MPWKCDMEPRWHSTIDPSISGSRGLNLESCLYWLTCYRVLNPSSYDGRLEPKHKSYDRIWNSRRERDGGHRVIICRGSVRIPRWPVIGSKYYVISVWRIPDDKLARSIGFDRWSNFALMAAGELCDNRHITERIPLLVEHSASTCAESNPRSPARG